MHTIDSLRGMREALEQGAAETMALDPPPHGPAYRVVLFEPTTKQNTTKLDAQRLDLQIEYTYCILFERASAGHVRVYNSVYSDRGKEKATLLGKAESVVHPSTEDWRRSYRTQQPVKTPLNLSLLQRRLAKQKAFADDCIVARRDPLLVALQKREKRLAHQRNKQLRSARVLAVNLQEDAGASSSDNSSASE